MTRARFEALWQTLNPEQQAGLARDYATRAQRDGAYVVLPDGKEVAIPPILTPVAIERARMEQASADAHAITRALTKVTAELMQDPARAPLKQRLFGAFTALEAEALGTSWRRSEQLATVRVDFLVDPSGRARALEVNTTIPAMQGYSDAIAAAFVRALAAARGRSDAETARLIDDNGRNSDDLLASLLAHHQRLGGRTGAQSIAIVARAGDAQYGELLHYVRRWSELGHRVFIATPDVVAIEGGRAVVDGVIPDLIYRHIFARRLDAAGAFARICLDPERFHVFNPISSHLEVKGMLGLLSAAASDDESAARIGLDDEERAAAARAVPWTRLFVPGATSGPDGAPVDDLPEWVRAHGRRLVLKRSWDYGGKGVFLGAELVEGAATHARLEALLGRADGGAPVGWNELCAHALADGDAWVVQELVPSALGRYLRVDGGEVHERELWADLSAFSNLGEAPRPSGGAVRASESRIVNILGGGGLAPLLREDVLSRLLD